jgi:hypothetical protein
MTYLVRAINPNIESKTRSSLVPLVAFCAKNILCGIIISAERLFTDP